LKFVLFSNYISKVYSEINLNNAGRKKEYTIENEAESNP
jgi:hypothetical protein